MTDSRDACKRFWCELGEAGADPEASSSVPGRLDHLTGCPTCHAEFSDLVARWSSLRATLAPEAERAPLPEDRSQAILDAMRRAAQGEEPGERPDANRPEGQG